MTMSKEYWVKRFEEEEIRNSKASFKELQIAKKQYRNSIDKINDELRLLHSKYAVENNLSYQDAQKLLTSSEKKKLKLSLEEYIKLGEEQNINFDPNVEKLLVQTSSEVHISRLEALKSNLQAELDVLYSGIERGLGNHFNDIINESYARTSYLVQSMSGAYAVIDAINQDLVNKIIFKPWTSDGVNWSNRLWKQKDKLVDEVHTALTQSLILGDDINTLVDKVATRLDVGYSRVANLLLTESAAYHSKATELCYKDLEVEKYEILATLDSRTSNICQGMDGKIFDRKDYKVGVTAPPFHCRCRTTTIPYFEEMTEDETRAARTENNNPVEEKAAMKYGEWREKYYGKNEEIQLKNNEQSDSIVEIEKLKNSMEKENYEEYIKRINSSHPKIKDLYEHRIDELKEMSYNENSAWYNKSQNKLLFHYTDEIHINDGVDKYSVLAHELGHFFDKNEYFSNLTYNEVDLLNKKIGRSFELFKRVPSSSDNFLNAMRKDASTLLSTFKTIKDDLISTSASGGVQDMIDGFFSTFNNRLLPWGHGENYYNATYNQLIKPLKLEKVMKEAYLELKLDASNMAKVKRLIRVYKTGEEAWANIIAAITVGGKELEYIKKYLPNTYESCLAILENVK
ncbi:MAG: minor capsid protein [Fusobacterium gastrosuis]|uniref:minor capsid protein n=1 Tax=Fusobacterium gastrosuis TaxID=1755100 RepID=UPI002A942722|nr:minor capsid protein [Fusobacterium gastrosuis]